MNTLSLAFTARQTLMLVGAEQSSIGWEGVPERAIDGRTDGNYWRK
jgi:hypothetical protein